MDAVEKMPVRLKVAAILRTAILTGEIADGQTLSLTETAERLGVSRTPVREAFQLLESEGLIELRMNREAVVHTIDEAFIREHFAMRTLLEGEAIERATRNGMDLTALEAAQAAIERTPAADVPRMYDAYNHDFHHALWEGAKNRKLYGFLESLWNGPSYSRTRGTKVNHPLSVREHGEMLALMKNGEAAKAREAMHRHMTRSCAIILENMGKA